MKKLNEHRILVLNKNWMPINTRTLQKALTLLIASEYSVLHVIDLNNLVPLTWDEWVKLPVGENDAFIQTPHKKVKMPSIIISNSYKKVHMRNEFTTIQERDNMICQYSGEKLTKENSNIDHIIPTSKGGPDTWENKVLSHKRINSKKGNRFNKELGLVLLNKPRAPKKVLPSSIIKNVYNIPEWDIFLTKKKTTYILNIEP